MEERHFTNTVEFDRAGRLVMSDGVAVPEQASGTVSYRSGLKVRTYHVPPQYVGNPSTSFGHNIEGHEGWYCAPGCTHSETLYDAEDRPAELRLLNASGRVLTRVTLKRDEAGRVIEEQQRGSAGMPWHARLIFMIAARRRTPFNFSRYFSYDDLGRRTEMRSATSILGEERQTFEYNDHGDIAVQRSLAVNRTFSIDWLFRRRLDSEQQHESETRFEYVYDERGNWTEQTVRLKDSEPPSSRDTRKITYWE